MRHLSASTQTGRVALCRIQQRHRNNMQYQTGRTKTEIPIRQSGCFSIRTPTWRCCRLRFSTWKNQRYMSRSTPLASNQQAASFYNTARTCRASRKFPPLFEGLSSRPRLCSASTCSGCRQPIRHFQNQQRSVRPRHSTYAPPLNSERSPSLSQSKRKGRVCKARPSAVQRKSQFPSLASPRTKTKRPKWPLALRLSVCFLWTRSSSTKSCLRGRRRLSGLLRRMPSLCAL